MALPPVEGFWDTRRQLICSDRLRWSCFFWRIFVYFFNRSNPPLCIPQILLRWRQEGNPISRFFSLGVFHFNWRILIISIFIINRPEWRFGQRRLASGIVLKSPIELRDDDCVTRIFFWAICNIDGSRASTTLGDRVLSVLSIILAPAAFDISKECCEL